MNYASIKSRKLPAPWSGLAPAGEAEALRGSPSAGVNLCRDLTAQLIAPPFSEPHEGDRESEGGVQIPPLLHMEL